MSFLVDIHTHSNCLLQYDVIKLVSLMVGEKIPSQTENCFFTYGIHPWQLEMQKKNLLIEIFEQEIVSGSFVAIGEIGIDKTRKIPLELQTKVFEYQLETAKQKQFPVVLHVVKAMDEIIQSMSRIKVNIPMILHAFNGTGEQITQLAKKGFYFSVGSVLNNSDSKMAKSLKVIPPDRLFFETDTHQQAIKQVYQKASEMLNMDMQLLQQTVFDNFKRCFPFAKLNLKPSNL